MKIAIICSSVLLKNALTMFLKEHISSYKSCDFVVCDKKIEIEKPIFVISHHGDANCIVPFSKANLLIALEKYYKVLQNNRPVRVENFEIDMDMLEYKISQACKNFEQEVLSIVKDAYEQNS